MSIKLSKPAFVQVSPNAMHPYKIERIVPNYRTALGHKTELKPTGETDPDTQEPLMEYVTTRQGYIEGWANDEGGNRLEGYEFKCEIETLRGKDILREIHLDLMGNLQLLNEDIHFELSSAFQ